MIQFNSDHIIVGQIKQLLHSFNLPTYRVYTKEQRQYYEKTGQELNVISSVPIITGSTNIPDHVRYIDYIKDNKIQRYYAETTIVNGTAVVKAPSWHETGKTYYYNKKELNRTKNLKITNNIYDTYTHEYLGNYLRFQRDYNGINLMPFYNCFSNNIVSSSLKYEIQTSGIAADEAGYSTKIISTFDTSNDKYKIYMVPVKAFQTYTIAVDSADGLELCCGIYDKYSDTREKLAHIPSLTYLNVKSASFNHPFLYDKLLDITNSMSEESNAELATIEKNLKLFIKLPAENKSTIVILEGNYCSWNDKSVYEEISSSGQTKMQYTNFAQTNIYNNHIVNNYEKNTSSIFDTYPDFNERNMQFITALQLLLLNTGQQYPFSDKLIEFLTDNVINPLDTISDNIKRAQTVIKENNNEIDVDGIWSGEMQAILYDFVNSKTSLNNITSSDRVDCIGYGDKVVEKAYKSTKITTTRVGDKTKRTREVINTLNDINLYESTYKNNYKGGSK